MNLRFKHNTVKTVLAVLVAPLALIGVAFSMSTLAGSMAFSAAGDTQQETGSATIGVQATSISMDVKPWCGWTTLAQASSAIALTPAAGQDTTYDGDSITMTASGIPFGVKVAPVVADSDRDPYSSEAMDSFTAAGANDCSWFASTEVNGVSINTTVEDNLFTAISSKNTGGTTPDATMNFATDLSNEQNLTINNTAEATFCASPWSFTGSPLVVSTLSSATTGANVVSLPRESTMTNSICKWSSSYSVTIPAGLKPLYGNSTYTYAGPAVTNTMIYTRP